MAYQPAYHRGRKREATHIGVFGLYPAHEDDLPNSSLLDVYASYAVRSCI